jgi:type VI protein secretion system component VasA
MKQADLRDMFRKASKSVCTSTVVVSPEHLSPTPSMSSAMMTPENTEEDLDDPEPVNKGDI